VLLRSRWFPLALLGVLAFLLVLLALVLKLN
jgi:hypothetical protein